jgi:hypothetical protein
MTETRAVGQRAIGLGVSLCLICLAYFYALDHRLLPSTGFSPIFRFLLRADANTAWLAAAICFLGVLWSLPVLWSRSAPILRFVEFLGEHALWIACASVAVFALGTIVVYHDYPLSMDEYAAVFQAKIFASGHLTAQLPPNYIDWLVVRGFNGEFLIASGETGRAIEEYWPGFALLLAPFEFIRLPYLCNALLAGLALFLIHWITRQITQDKRAAGWALLFAMASGAFVADAISYYSMQAHMTANLLFAALLLQPSRYRAFGAGLIGSLALILHNPVPHTFFAIPWLIAVAVNRKQRRYLPALILGYLPGLCMGWAWLALQAVIGSAAHHLSLGSVVHGVFTWPTAAVLNIRTASLVKVWIWAVPCLFVFAAVGCFRHRKDLRVRLLAASAILTFVGYLFVAFDQGHGWGYRYFHSAWGVIPILAACAMTDRSEANQPLVSFAGAVAVLSLGLLIPFQMHQIEGFISAHLAQLGRARRPGNNIYFIHPRGGFYVADMVQIDPQLRGKDLMLVSRGAALDAKLVLDHWPQALKITGDRAYDQWYLGPDEDPGRFKSLAVPGKPTPPSAADR